MLHKLFQFNGGVKPTTHKAESTREPIARLPLPRELVIPLHQSIGGTPRPLVQVGQQVLKGQIIGAADGNVSAAVHASTSGRVTAVEMRLMPHSSGLSALCVVIAPDGEEASCERQPVAWRSLTPDEVRDQVRDQGVVGLGGAVFPTHLKLKPGRQTAVKTVVLNGAECEPFITCDDLLMRERAAGIVEGARILRHMLQAEEVLIGIEDNKPEAVAALQAAIARLGDDRQRHQDPPPPNLPLTGEEIIGSRRSIKNDHSGSESIKVVAVPTRYPAGGAKQLIRVLTGIEVPHGERSTDYGVQCFNVGTAFALHEALNLGQPMVSRIVTVGGNVERPRNYEVLFGTPMSDVIAQSRARPDTDRVIMGGPMMGFLMPADSVPVVKATNCILVGSPALFPPPPPEMPCIRCGECAKACPADLQPFELYWFSKAKIFGKAQEYHLFDCIECGCCAYVCPSRIPLVDYYRFAKSEIWAREAEKESADEARERYEFRLLREEREKQERAAKLAAKTAAAREKAAAMMAVAGEAAAEDPKKALIAAALARAEAQKAAQQKAAEEKQAEE